MNKDFAKELLKSAQIEFDRLNLIDVCPCARLLIMNFDDVIEAIYPEKGSKEEIIKKIVSDAALKYYPEYKIKAIKYYRQAIIEHFPNESDKEIHSLKYAKKLIDDEWDRIEWTGKP